MRSLTIHPAHKLSGTIVLPGDKSISHRAVMLGAIAEGRTAARGVLECDDCDYTIRAFRAMGVEISKEGDTTFIDGTGLKGLKKPAGPIDLGESGTSMRILAGILAGQDFDTVLKGQASLTKRPMARIIEPLSLMGARLRAAQGGFPPLEIKGGALKAVQYTMPVSSAQVKSAILLAGLYADGVTAVEEKIKSRDHTERMMKYFGADLTDEGLRVLVKGGRKLSGKTLEIPGDISSASFFMVGASILEGSRVRMKRVSINPTRAGILGIMSRMGAKVRIANTSDAFEPYADIEVESGPTRGIVIGEEEIPSIIDELPAIFVLAAFSKGRTVIKGAEELRVKETDRIDSMKENLAQMGVAIDVSADGIVIDGGATLKGAGLNSFGDHRTCMAMAVAALAADGKSEIDGIECVTKSFPGFFDVLDSLKK